MAQAAVIIVNWNTGKLLADCLQSLRDLPEEEMVSRVVVVDNASTDGSLARAEARVEGWEKLRVVRQAKNMGFAAANNRGVQVLVREGDRSSHIWLLNPDTAVKPGCLRELVGLLGREPKAGVAGPQLLNPDGSVQQSVRRFPTGTILAGILLKLPRFWKGWPAWRKYIAADFNYFEEQRVDQVMGASFLVRREVWEVFGGLDEGFWIWFEEVDFCRRAVEAGWEVWYTPNGQTVHYGGASFSQLAGWRKSRPWIKSSWRYARKHLLAQEQILVAGAVPVAAVLSVGATLAHRRVIKDNQKRIWTES